MPARYVSKQQHAPPQPQTICTAALARSPLERRKGLFRRRDGDEAADRRPHAPSGTDAASDSRNADHLATPSLISASTGGPTRGPIPVRSAVRFWQKFLPAAKGGAPRRGIVKRRTRASPQRVRALPRRSRRPSVRLRPVWHHSTRTPLPCVPQALHRSGRSTHRCSSQCIPPLLARAARSHPAHCQCCARCALSQARGMSLPPGQCCISGTSFNPACNSSASFGPAQPCGTPTNPTSCHKPPRAISMSHAAVPTTSPYRHITRHILRTHIHPARL